MVPNGHQGDEGWTSLADGTRVRKDHPRTTAIGQLDELNSLLGWCRAAAGQGESADRLAHVQDDLFTLGAELAYTGGGMTEVAPSRVYQNLCRQLETWIDDASAATGPLTHFILPGGCELAARLHMARTCTRRAERAVVALADLESVRGEVLVYLNRLGELLFVWARLANRQAGSAETAWPRPG